MVPSFQAAGSGAGHLVLRNVLLNSLIGDAPLASLQLDI